MKSSESRDGRAAGSVSRREFVRLAALAGLLAGCGPAALPPAPTDTPVPPTATPLPPTATPAPPTATSIPGSAGRPAVIKMFPDAPSRVVYTTHAGVWSGDTLVPGALQQMLDASITKLTGLADARQAWAALFKPNERIAIKINAFRNSIVWTHVPLVDAVVARLKDAGIPGQQIVIYDAQSDEIKTAGFTLADNPSDVQCRGTDKDYKVSYQVASGKVQLSEILQNCDAVINMPLLKSHMITGMTFALKNHYGSVDYPDGLHYPVDGAMAQLNALAPIRERTRLIIGDVLTANLKYEYSWPYWRDTVKANSILMSYDAVAHDTVGLDIFQKLSADNGLDPSSNKSIFGGCLKASADLRLGTNDPAKMDLVKVNLS